ncbi:hypothetical protein HKX48_005769 [Thoreauomyces humboldtii]|nr:hypothetical protein HKX48_005769 [Thoreauomyces humboldtii]
MVIDIAHTSSFTVSRKSHVTAEEKEEIYKNVVWEGARAAGIAGTGAAIAAYVAHQTVPAFNRVRLPFKTFLCLAVTTGTFFTVTDRASIRVSRGVAAKRSVVPGKYEDSPLVLEKITGVREWMIKNRYPLVMSAWTGTLALGFLYNFRRNDILTAQKIINARMVAQTMALAGVGGLAALAATDPHEKHVDRHFEKVLEEAEKHEKAEKAAKSEKA